MVAEIQRVVVEYKSGPQGRAAVQRRVAEANSRIAETLCSCAVCEEAAQGVRGQSRARTTAVAEQRATALESSRSAEAAGVTEPQLQSSAAQVGRLTVGSKKGNEKERKKRQRAKRKVQEKATAVEKGQMQQAAVEKNAMQQAALGDEATLTLAREGQAEMMTDTVLEPTAASIH